MTNSKGHMEGRTFVILVLSGLCFLPVFSSRNYMLVTKAKSWAEARSYCRTKYHDLASVNDQTELDKLVAAGPRHYHVWIGLYYDGWSWSLEKEGYYGEEEAEFRMWRVNEPNNYFGIEKCTIMGSDGLWNDCPCTATFSFVCYNGGVETLGSSSFIFVNQPKTWKEAQSYCREHHTDLASVRNQAENDQIKTITQSNVWIGLYTNGWKWSDGRPFWNWNINGYEPIDNNRSHCGLLHDGQWERGTCEKKHLFFICQLVDKMQWVVTVKVTKKDSFVNMEDAAEDILQQFRKALKDHGLSEIKLTWRKQPDGKIFEEKEKNKETSSNVCPRV